MVMPSTTFLNLKHSKRLAFLQEAYKEFALHPLESASITNLVNSLGIAKGSVYQYFNDKEDLYTYLVQNAHSRLVELLEKACPYNGEEFFIWYEKTLIVEVKFYLSIPAYAMLLHQTEYVIDQKIRELNLQTTQGKLDFIEKALPEHINSDVHRTILINTPRIIFQQITSTIDLQDHIENNRPIDYQAEKLLQVCSEWISILRSGI